jgi:hypothetical protein
MAEPEHISSILRRVFADMGENLDHILALQKIRVDLEDQIRTRFDPNLSLAVDCILYLLEYFSGGASAFGGECPEHFPSPNPSGGFLDETESS